MHTINNHFVCFACRLRVRHNKYEWKPSVACPKCGGACANMGDRCPIPPKNKEKAWQQLAQNYRQLQRAILADYVHWKQKLLHIIDKHLVYAEAMDLCDAAANDRLWKTAVMTLPELPRAFAYPFVFINTLPRTQHTIAWSAINQKDYCNLNDLLARPYNSERQKEIDKLLAEKKQFAYL